MRLTKIGDRVWEKNYRSQSSARPSAKERQATLLADGMRIANDVPQPGDTGMPRLTVEQAAIVQGFPTWWKISGKKTNAYRRVGNAFPPAVAEAVGEQIVAAFRAVDGKTAIAENASNAVSA